MTLRSIWRTVPPLARIGLYLGAVGVVVDAVHHGLPHHLLDLGSLHLALFGHLLTFVGMLAALAGVVRAAVDSRLRTRRKGGSDASRSRAATTR